MLMERTHAYAMRFLGGLSERRVFNCDRSPVSAIRDMEVRDEPRPVEELLDLIDASVVETGLKPAHGGHLGYIPGGGLYAAALGDYLAAVTNEFSGVRFTGPGAAEVEWALLAWMAKVVGYPDTFSGSLVSGGSVANLVGVVTAREAAGLHARDYERAVVYASSHAHYSLHKGLRVAGLGETVLREVEVDGDLRMRPASLSASIEEDRAAGLTPWLVVASAGTTDTGAIDPLARIADVAEREGAWLHVDAAYGGFFALLDEVRPMLAGMERADSIVLDPHKGLFLPYGTGAVLVREGALLRAAFGGHSPVLQDIVAAEQEGYSPAATSPELSKHFRGFRTWLPLLLHGEAPFRACLAEKLELARYFRGEVAALGFEVGWEPQLSVVAFRWLPEQGDANAFNSALMDEVHRDGRIFLSSTRIDGAFFLRMAALVFRTRLETIDLALAVLAECVEKVESDPGPWRG